jgi:hypothetical protein
MQPTAGRDAVGDLDLHLVMLTVATLLATTTRAP